MQANKAFLRINLKQMLMENATTVHKTSEKVLLWMKRNNYSQQYVAAQIGVTRQTLAKRLEDNFFSSGDLIALKRIGFES